MIAHFTQIVDDNSWVFKEGNFVDVAQKTKIFEVSENVLSIFDVISVENVVHFSIGSAA
jgi:hypothetical protein